MTNQPQSSGQSSRERFESWAVDQISGNGLPYFCMKNKDGEYHDGGTTHALKGWQARDAEVLALQEHLSLLQDRARAVVARWDGPKWKDLPHTANFIHALRDAIGDELINGLTYAETSATKSVTG